MTGWATLADNHDNISTSTAPFAWQCCFSSHHFQIVPSVNCNVLKTIMVQTKTAGHTRNTVTRQTTSWSTVFSGFFFDILKHVHA